MSSCQNFTFRHLLVKRQNGWAVPLFWTHWGQEPLCCYWAGCQSFINAPAHPLDTHHSTHYPCLLSCQHEAGWGIMSGWHLYSKVCSDISVIHGVCSSQPQWPYCDRGRQGSVADSVWPCPEIKQQQQQCVLLPGGAEHGYPWSRYDNIPKNIDIWKLNTACDCGCEKSQKNI